MTPLETDLQDAASGDEKAFSRIYVAWYTELFRFVRGRVSRTEDAEDITQNVFIKLYTAIKEERITHLSKPFFFTIARQILIDHYRRKSTHDIISDEAVLEHGDIETDQLPYGENIDIEKVLGHLTEDERELVTLRYWNDLSTEEIATIVNKKPDAVRKALSRIIKKTKTYI
jgi:RNA polymerase sigma-70 factor (ECF subfamily)